jgi:hypothetical protein
LFRGLPPTYSDRTLLALREAVRQGGLAVRVAGDSMVPALPEGTRVTVRPTRVFWPGDLVAYARTDARLVVHRVLGYRPGWRWTLLTRGDAAGRPDPAVSLDRVVGRAVAQGHRAVTLVHRLRALSEYLALAGRSALRHLR